MKWEVIDYVMVVLVVAIMAVIVMGIGQQYDRQSTETVMKDNGCVIVSYAGRGGFRVFECPGYKGVLSAADWKGPKSVESLK